MSWDDKLVEDFLLEYRKHECLWNQFHRQFHDCLAKSEALKKVAKNLRLGVDVQDCLRLLKCIREKYVENQAKDLRKLRSSICQPKWMQYVDSMLEKIICDEQRKSNRVAATCRKPEATVKHFHRLTIPSKKRRCSSFPKQGGRRKAKRSKLARRGRCCSNNAEKNMDRRAAQDCSGPHSSCCPNYLDESSWARPSCKPIECPGLASHIERVSRIENIGKDPCASTPVYMCPNRATHTHCNQNHGRRRHTDIYPTITEPRSCRSPPRSQACAPPRKPSPERDRCSSAKKEKKRCPSPVEDKCAVLDQKVACTRDTCPSYSRLKTTEPSKTCDIKPECPPDKSVRLSGDACTPRVAARFENGVLEAYSQFKVVFPSQDQPQQQGSRKKCCAQKVQTDSTTRERAVGVCSREFLRRKRSSSSKCSLRKKDTLVGTDEDFAECNQPDENACLDYVLLTPAGKYVPLVRTDEADDDQCTCAKTQRQDSCTARNSDKQNSTSCDDKCPSTTTTTKLLLRCLEHMLDLQEQHSTSNAKPTEACEPCRRSKERYEQLANNASSSCLPCLEERLNNCTSSRGKLTQDFLDILKCAMGLDCNRKNNAEDECDEDHRNGIAASSTPNSTSESVHDKCKQKQVSARDAAVGCDDECCIGHSRAVKASSACSSKAVQCEPRKARGKQSKRHTVLDNLVRCANWPEYNTARNLSVALKCDEDDDDQEPNVKRVPATTLTPSMQRQTDQTLAGLREELQRDKEYFEQGNAGYVKCNHVYRSVVVRSPRGASSPTRQYYR